MMNAAWPQPSPYGQAPFAPQGMPQQMYPAVQQQLQASGPVGGPIAMGGQLQQAPPQATPNGGPAPTGQPSANNPAPPEHSEQQRQAAPTPRPNGPHYVENAVLGGTLGGLTVGGLTMASKANTPENQKNPNYEYSDGEKRLVFQKQERRGKPLFANREVQLFEGEAEEATAQFRFNTKGAHRPGRMNAPTKQNAVAELEGFELRYSDAETGKLNESGVVSIRPLENGKKSGTTYKVEQLQEALNTLDSFNGSPPSERIQNQNAGRISFRKQIRNPDFDKFNGAKALIDRFGGKNKVEEALALAEDKSTLSSFADFDKALAEGAQEAVKRNWGDIWKTSARNGAIGLAVGGTLALGGTIYMNRVNQRRQEVRQSLDRHVNEDSIPPQTRQGMMFEPQDSLHIQ